jgi:hypothetical protein
MAMAILIGILLLICMLTLQSAFVLSQDRSNPERIEATAVGKDTNLSKEFDVRLIIYEYSHRAGNQILVEALQNGQDQGLVNALSKMKVVGHIVVTGTLGYDVSYIQMIATRTGRKIRFVASRSLRFGVVRQDNLSTTCNLMAGEFDLDDEDETKSTGVLFPDAELVLDQQRKVKINLTGNPWKLVDIIDCRGTPGINWTRQLRRRTACLLKK